MVGALNMGKLEEPPKEKEVPKGFALNIPSNKLQEKNAPTKPAGVPSLGLGGKIPALNMGNVQTANEEMNSKSSGNNSSKREGIARLNIGKAV
jgi:transcription elongation factor